MNLCRKNIYGDGAYYCKIFLDPFFIYFTKLLNMQSESFHHHCAVFIIKAAT